MGIRMLTINVNGYDIQAKYREEDIKTVFMPFLQHVIQLQKKSGKRLIVFLAAPPATGKSTLAIALCQFARELGCMDMQYAGMDGFHYTNAWLDTHFQDGKKLKELKGAPETFDAEAMYALIKETKGSDTWWPVYDRNLHEPLKHKLHITGSILLVEGNYLLLDEKPYRSLSALCDYCVFIQAEENLLRDRLIDRKSRGGLSKEQAEVFYEKSDRCNVLRVLHNRLNSDEVWKLCTDGGYRLISRSFDESWQTFCE